jgi:chorismate synthase
VTNGQPVIVRAAMKPLSTLRTPLKSVDLATKEAVEAVVERSDVCAVPAAGIVGEAMMAIVLADAFLEKFGGDGLDEVRRNYRAYQDSLRTW